MFGHFSITKKAFKEEAAKEKRRQKKAENRFNKDDGLRASLEQRIKEIVAFCKNLAKNPRLLIGDCGGGLRGEEKAADLRNQLKTSLVKLQKFSQEHCPDPYVIEKCHDNINKLKKDLTLIYNSPVLMIKKGPSGYSEDPNASQAKDELRQFLALIGRYENWLKSSSLTPSLEEEQKPSEPSSRLSPRRLSQG